MKNATTVLTLLLFCLCFSVAFAQSDPDQLRTFVFSKCEKQELDIPWAPKNCKVYRLRFDQPFIKQEGAEIWLIYTVTGWKKAAVYFNDETIRPEDDGIWKSARQAKLPKRKGKLNEVRLIGRYPEPLPSPIARRNYY